MDTTVTDLVGIVTQNANCSLTKWVHATQTSNRRANGVTTGIDPRQGSIPAAIEETNIESAMDQQGVSIRREFQGLQDPRNQGQ